MSAKIHITIDLSNYTKQRVLILLLGLWLVGPDITFAYAGSTSSATASVFVNVVPNIVVSAKTSIVNAGTMQTGQTGDFSATFVFTLEANAARVKMFLEASDLHKSDDPTKMEVSPILLNTSKPARFAASAGRQISGKPNEAIWAGAGNDILSFKTKATEAVEYESSKKGYFNQDVTISITYIQPDPKKPIGQYSGRVRLSAFIVP